MVNGFKKKIPNFSVLESSGFFYAQKLISYPKY
jgi:hypothetical protein